MLNDARGDEYAEAIRSVSRHLIVLDNQTNGLPIAEMAARAFKKVHRRLGAGAYEQKYERDILAAAAELAEIAGWALFNAGEFEASRRFNQEALFLARLAGDRSMELLVLQNMGMLAGWVGRPREELLIARSVMGQERLTPRIESMFRAREAQALARVGQEAQAALTFRRARSLLEESTPDNMPAWAWWITKSEIDRQQGRALHETGQWREAIPILRQAMDPRSEAQVGYRNVASVRLLACLLAVKDWRAAEQETEEIIPAVGEMSSIVSLKLLGSTAAKGAATTDAPSSLRDGLHQISVAINEDPYTF
ncbi:tetratricopeptide repeat protein [Streptomyces specialis]|uniref:hypothetical protein n=1 Tax=Streptomyces specialis TaxID=498367 RepID=UPI001F3E1DC8|nr:hypothetical protein [Streptomyces specialis]